VPSSPAGVPRIGVLWRGQRGDRRPAQGRGLEPLFASFKEQPVEIVPVPFDDNRVDEVRKQIRQLDGLLTWVNPIQDGANRAQVDELLREASAGGVFVSADPAVIMKMGTKEVLYSTRQLGWGSDTELYVSPEDFAQRFHIRLETHRRLVVKQGRGNGGNGVWKVEVEAGSRGGLTRDSPVRLQDARTGDGSSTKATLGTFVDRCTQYFEWSGSVVDQVFQERLADGLLRCYFSHGEVVGFCHQWPRGLLEFDPSAPPPEPPLSVMEGPDVAAYQPLRRLAEQEWVPGMARLLGLELFALPVVWDADFLYGPKDALGQDSYVLCEINVSAVWPFPPMAAPIVASNALARTKERRVRRQYGAN
jgi:hypothetical protein